MYNNIAQGKAPALQKETKEVNSDHFFAKANTSINNLDIPLNQVVKSKIDDLQHNIILYKGRAVFCINKCTNKKLEMRRYSLNVHSCPKPSKALLSPSQDPHDC